jgi:hypothetical protein
MNGELAIQQMVAFFLRCFDTDFKNGITLKLDRFVAADAN